MSVPKCKKCGKFVRTNEVMNNGKEIFCGDCAIKEIVKIHGVSHNKAYHTLELNQFGNGHAW